VAALADRRRLQVWDIASATVSSTYSGHLSEVYALDISKDAHMIASGSADRTVRLWDTESGSEIAQFTFPDTPVSVAISSDPAMLVAGSLDGTLSFWPIQGIKSDDEPKNRFQGHKGSVHSIAISKHNLLVSGSEDNTVRLWPHDPQNGFKQLRHKVRSHARHEHDSSQEP
jgi:glucose repression regulatory protein TUP1